MKSTFEEMGGTYRRVGDYYLPNIAVPEVHYDIGKYGRMHSPTVGTIRMTVTAAATLTVLVGSSCWQTSRLVLSRRCWSRT